MGSQIDDIRTGNEYANERMDLSKDYCSRENYEQLKTLNGPELNSLGPIMRASQNVIGEGSVASSGLNSWKELVGGNDRPRTLDGKDNICGTHLQLLSNVSQGNEALQKSKTTEKDSQKCQHRIKNKEIRALKCYGNQLSGRHCAETTSQYCTERVTKPCPRHSVLSSATGCQRRTDVRNNVKKGPCCSNVRKMHNCETAKIERRNVNESPKIREDEKTQTSRSFIMCQEGIQHSKSNYQQEQRQLTDPKLKNTKLQTECYIGHRTTIVKLDVDASYTQLLDQVIGIGQRTTLQSAAAVGDLLLITLAMRNRLNLPGNFIEYAKKGNGNSTAGVSVRYKWKLKYKSESEIISREVIKSDYLLPGGDKDRCFVCSKDLKHLDELRRSLHVNNCLDQQEAYNKYETKKEKWKKTVDCPICGEPTEPGPVGGMIRNNWIFQFRSAHAKRCGKKYHVNPNSLLLLFDTQTKIAEVKKRNGTAHTKRMEPKLETKRRCNQFIKEPRSLFLEQMNLATALSASMSSNGSEPYNETQDLPQNPIPIKIRCEKQRPRSFSFVELEPRSCKCAVIERVQENFLNVFKTRDEKQDMHTVLKKNVQSTEEILKHAGVCVRKLHSLEQLADDLMRFTENNSDVTVFSRENETFLTCRFIIAARAPALLQHLNADGSLYLREYSGAAIRSYITFLTSASMIWTENERKEVNSMAEKFGPEGLAALCKSAKLAANWNKETTLEKHLERAVDENHVGQEKVEEIEIEEGNSNEKVGVHVDGKEMTNDDSDDPSIVFVEEVWRKTNVDEVTNITGNVSKKTPRNLSRNERESNGFVIGDPDVFRCLFPSCKKSIRSEESKYPEERFVAESTSLNFLRDQAYKDVSLSFPTPSCTTSNPNVLDHLNDSVKSLFNKLSPIKALPVHNGELLSPFACSSQAVTDSLSPEKLLIPSVAIFNTGTHLSEKMTRTKSSPEFSFIPKKSSSPLSSSSLLSLIDQTPVPLKNICSSPEKKKIRVEASVHSTPDIPASRLVQRLKELGSNVKIVKTKDVTPMPVYDLMNDKELKAELARFGVRPLGKKRAIALLKKIYHETHPVLEHTPLTRKSKKMLNNDGELKEKQRIDDYSNEDCDADKTLNRSLDECDIMEESYINEEQSAVIPKDLEGMQNVLLNWLRREENSTLYNHLLGLNVISFEEFANRLSHADSTVSQIPKKALMEILDRLHVTFQMPMIGWERKRRRAKK
uniref:Uncharacterized protein n=1 Tax=Setaria digitata TaxID=48799 RepID=A0A915PWB7_9BILA